MTRWCDAKLKNGIGPEAWVIEELARREREERQDRRERASLELPLESPRGMESPGSEVRPTGNSVIVIDL